MSEESQNNGDNLVIRDERGRVLPGSKLAKGKTRHKATALAYAMFDQEAEEVIRSVLDRAKEGDATAMKLTIDRIIPPRKCAPLKFDIPEVNTSEDARRAISLVLGAQCAGEITADEAEGILKTVQTFMTAVSLAELEARLSALSEQMKP